MKDRRKLLLSEQNQIFQKVSATAHEDSIGAIEQHQNSHKPREFHIRFIAAKKPIVLKSPMVLLLYLPDALSNLDLEFLQHTFGNLHLGANLYFRHDTTTKT